MEFNSIIAKTFKKEGFSKIRVALLNDEPMFNLYDICSNLGYVRIVKPKGREYKQIRKDFITKLCESLDITGLATDWKTFKITYECRDKIDFENTWINEQNFYGLCLESHAKNAKIFKKWVTREVLPSIRKTGQYNISSKNDELKKLKMEQMQLEFTMNILKVSKASEVKMIKKFNDSQGLSTAYLPDYLDEQEGHSATELLKEYKVPLTTIKFNKLMLQHGFLEECTRNSTNAKGYKHYKKLTEKGLNYGKNVISSRGTEKETQPLYYKSKFEKLIHTLSI